MVDANVPDIALEPDKTVKKLRLYISFISKKIRLLKKYVQNIWEILFEFHLDPGLSLLNTCNVCVSRLRQNSD